MQQQVDNHVFTGMQKDLSISKHPANYLYDAQNIRITARENGTLLSITNERGPKDLEIKIEGDYLGHCVLNQYLIVFSTTTNDDQYKGKDYITRINLENLEYVPKESDSQVKQLYYSSKGNLHFSTMHPIEAIASYENANIQKVYWTDGNNQPRVINIAPFKDANIEKYTPNSFDFVQELALKEYVTVEKVFGAGEFPPGMIQYAFTYYNKYGQESNIFYTTKLYPISHWNRGGSPEDKIANQFKIKISDIDLNFDYVRIYSILRTSKNATPIVKRLQDININTNIGIAKAETSNWGYNQDLGILQGEPIMTISLDKGATFKPLTSISYFLWTNKDCPKPKNSKSTTLFNEMNNSSGAKPAHIYQFKKSDYPGLIIQIQEKYYTWGYETDSDAVIYLGLASHINVMVGETLDGNSNVNIDKYTSSNIYPMVQYIDDGTQGEDVDPTELLYKGGESIKASTIEQKDGTLFLGNLSITRPNLKGVKESIAGIFSPQTTSPDEILTSEDNYIKSIKVPSNGTVISTNIPYTNNIDISGFKSREIYRIGIQFQYKTGKWSEPFWIRDYKITDSPNINEGVIYTPQIQVKIVNSYILDRLIGQEYKRARLLMAQPTYTDRTIICQGIANPTLYQSDRRYTVDKDGINFEGQGPVYGQSSWIFRPKSSIDSTLLTMASDGGGRIPSSGSVIHLGGMDFKKGTTDNVASYAQTSIEVGAHLGTSSFGIDQSLITIHSPEIIFEDQLFNQNWSGAILQSIGKVIFTATLGDIDIQTSSPTIGSAAGFIHRSIVTDGDAALVSGLYYEDYIADDWNDTPTYGRYLDMHVPARWPIYLWHKNGSLNNDVSRAGQSAILQKKKISNYHIGGSTYFNTALKNHNVLGMELFTSDQVSIVKVNGHPYMGNIDTLVSPEKPEYKYFVMHGDSDSNPWVKQPATFFDSCHLRLGLKVPGDVNSKNGFWKLNLNHGGTPEWKNYEGDWEHIGNWVPDLCETSEGIRIKYKSTPHLVALLQGSTEDSSGIFNTDIKELPLVEVSRAYNADTLYGGMSDDALKSNMWIPISDPVTLMPKGITLTSNRGDTYFQRFECLKTYAFTLEDANQVVDIASFICETHVNIDGRYDRNRGQSNNLNMSPINFNLLNPVYSQMDNFFNYRILDDDYYKINSFPNQITWTKEKQSGADIDLWTNITLASTYDMDGSKGQIQSLNTWRDQIYCFQDKGISNILFNSRVQVAASDGVPIEISNSYKVDGYRYISDGTGCNNKRTIKETPTGIYFIDSVTNNLYHIGDGVSDISTTHNMSTWFQHNKIRRTVYDDVHHDLYIDNGIETLCYSEVLKEFTSRMSYGGIEYLESYGNKVFTSCENNLYEFGKGTYNLYFNKVFQPWSLNFISNGVSNQVNNSTLDKVFENLEFRMDRYSYNQIDNIWENEHNKSLDYIHVYNEYQDSGLVDLKTVLDRPSNLKKKFRIWRANIPRHLSITSYSDEEREAMLTKLQQTNPDATLEDIPTERHQRRDRIRNTWCNIELGIKNLNSDKIELHDINVYYYI